MVQSELADQTGTTTLASITARQQGQFLEGVSAWYTALET